ncbi:MAG: hypothetical protein V3R57_06190 [Candidatus Bathyarchaeia archaeon]
MKVGIIKTSSGIVPIEEFRDSVDISTGVTNFCNEYSPPLSPADYTGINADAIDLGKQWAWDFTLSILVQTGWKEEVLKSIELHRLYRMKTLVAEYPAASGKYFGCSDFDQNNWSKLATLDSRGLLVGSYPFKVHTANHSDSYDLIDSADLSQLLGAVSSAVLGERSLAQSYLDAVSATTNESGAITAAAPYLEL